MNTLPALRAGVALAATVGLLSGCTLSPQPGGAPTSNSPVPSSSAPTPAADPGDASTWTIDFDGIGPLRLRGSLSAAAPAVQASYAVQPPESCPNPTMTVFESAKHPTIWAQVNGLGSDEVVILYLG